MNSLIRSSMFTVPVTVHRMGGIDSAGDRVELEPHALTGYVYDEMRVVENLQGDKEVSQRRIYLAGEDITRISSTDRITCLGATSVPIIRREEYRGRNGITLLGVVYLP